MLAAVVLTGAPAATDQAVAAEGTRSFSSFFFPGQKVEPQSAAPQAALPKEQKPPVLRSATVKSPEAPDGEATAPKVEAAVEAHTVLVIGDFIAADLVQGLAARFAENPKMKILDRTDAAAGLLRRDDFEWLTKILAEEHPDAVVVLVGANDRQPLRVGARRELIGSHAWARAYAERAAKLAKRVADARVSLFWAGAPPFRSTRTSSDMLTFNDIYRKASTDAGGQYIDVWDGFADEKGNYAGIGADMNGQQVRLRTRDGIDFTEAGRRKLAFYVEKALIKRLYLSDGAAARKAKSAAPIATGVTPALRTAPISVTDPALDGGQDLLGSSETLPAAMINPATKQADPGFSSAPVPGRADDFYERR